MRKRFKEGLGILVACLAVMVVAPGIAGASQDSEVFEYGGVEITAQDALDNELICLSEDDVMNCFDTEAEADEAAADPEEGLARGVACSGVVHNLDEYVNLGYAGGGPSLGPNHVGTGWTQYNSTYDKKISSFKTGDYDANFNRHDDGTGVSYGVAPACSKTPNLAGSGFDDLFRSRKRIP